MDWWAFVIDVAGGDDIPRKNGLGLLRADLLVVNKIDLAPHVDVDMTRFRADVAAARSDRASVFTDLRKGEGVQLVLNKLSIARCLGGNPDGRRSAVVALCS